MSIKLVVLLACYLVTPSAADWEGFVFDKMRDFGPYIKENNFDPTPPIDQSQVYSDDRGEVPVDTELSQLSLSNFWTNIQPTHTRIDWIAREFDVGLETVEPFIVTGKHVSNWTLNGTPVKIQGNWILYHNPLYVKDCSIQFGILPSGYLNLTQVLYPCWPSWNSYNVSFEGTAGNEFVKPFLASSVSKYYNAFAEEPLTYIFAEFWREILSNTTLAELIGYTSTQEPANLSTPYWLPKNDADFSEGSTIKMSQTY